MMQRSRTRRLAERCLVFFVLFSLLAISMGCACGSAKRSVQEPVQETVLETGETADELASDSVVLEEVQELDEFDELDEEEPPAADPYERRNRKRYKFNGKMESCCVDPLANTYRKVIPDGLQNRFRNFRENLREPLNFVNQFLQLRFVDGTVSTSRFCINTTVGLLGFYDPSTKMGLEAINSDSGQTMYRYGVPKGPYLVLPFIGPSTARDGLGSFFDFFLRPDTYLLTPGAQLLWVSGEGVMRKSEVMDQLEILRRNSLDEYAMIRSAYLMDRMSWLRGRELTEEELDTLLYFE
jgi:phospholipid-binding lipoprotein MlaA